MITEHKKMLVSEFASTLGWPQPRTLRHVGPPEFGIIEWLECILHNGARLQINLLPKPFIACVYSPRHRICTKWQEVRCGRTPLAARAEAIRLKPVLGIETYTNTRARQLFRKAYPQYCGWTKARMVSPDESPLWPIEQFLAGG